MRILLKLPGEFGAGGRSSISGLNVALFGATGFLGRYVANELGSVGSTVQIANRGCEMETRHLKPMFDLGNMACYFYEGRDVESIEAAMEGCDVVVNMVGKRYETKKLLPTDEKGALKLVGGSRINYDYEEVNVQVAERIAKAATKMGVSQFIHFSALAAANPDTKSVWAQTKAAGEVAVKKAFPSATIVRPATMFGHEDEFLNWYAWMGERLRMPLIGDISLSGPVNEGAAVLQPVYVGDIASATMAMIEDPDAFKGKTVELAGPADFSRAEIAEFVNDVTKQKVPPAVFPKKVLSAIAYGVEGLNSPYLTVDEVELMDEDIKLVEGKEGVLTFADIPQVEKLTEIDEIAFQYLHRYRRGGHFVYAAGYH